MNLKKTLFGLLATTLIFNSGCSTLNSIQNKSLEIRKENYAVLLIDMQDSFLETINKKELEEEIPNQIEIIKYAQKNNISIYVLEYGRGSITKDLRNILTSPYQIIKKNHNNGFKETNLHKFLQQKKIKHLILIGAYASGCVKNTAQGAIENGLEIYTSRDLIQDPIISKFFNESSYWYKKNGTLFETHTDIINYLESLE